jgi:hypothetical protein
LPWIAKAVLEPDQQLPAADELTFRQCDLPRQGIQLSHWKRHGSVSKSRAAAAGDDRIEQSGGHSQPPGKAERFGHEPGALDKIVEVARHWFLHHLKAGSS